MYMYVCLSHAVQYERDQNSAYYLSLLCNRHQKPLGHFTEILDLSYWRNL